MDSGKEQPPGLSKDALQVEFRHMLCTRHGEPFRKQWPKGYAIVIVMLFQKVIQDEAIAEEAKKLTGKAEVSPHDAMALLEKKPCCCRVSDRHLLKTYEKTKIGTKAKCQYCNRKRLGTPYSLSGPGGITRHKHLCFECVIYNMIPWN